MVDVKEFLKKAGGNWWRADDLVAGDRLILMNAGDVDDKTFDRAYLVMTARLTRTGEEKNLRLGPKNTQRLTETFGTTDTAKWVNRVAEVMSIETYSGLGKKGFLLRGLPAQPQSTATVEHPTPTPAPAPKHPSLWTVHFLRKSNDIIEEGILLSQLDWDTLVPEEVKGELLAFRLIEKVADGYKFTEKAKEYIST